MLFGNISVVEQGSETILNEMTKGVEFRRVFKRDLKSHSTRDDFSRRHFSKGYFLPIGLTVEQSPKSACAIRVLFQCEKSHKMSNQADTQVNTVSTEALKQAVKQLPSKQKVRSFKSRLNLGRSRDANRWSNSSCMTTLHMEILTSSLWKSTTFIITPRFLGALSTKSASMRIDPKVHVWP